MEKNGNRILKISIYFIIYSIAGFLLETIYAIFTKGMLESRKSFIYGPFCVIYGIAAILMILVLSHYKNSNVKLYIGGTIIGLTVEYLASFLGEKILHAQWWEYSELFFNINGRICLFYAIMWGFLTIVLLKVIHPRVESMLSMLLDNINPQIVKVVVSFIMVFLFCDSIVSAFAIEDFTARVAGEYHIKMNGIDESKRLNHFYSKYFSDEKMILNYPNISLKTTDGQVIYIGSLLQDTRNYYYKFK